MNASSPTPAIPAIPAGPGPDVQKIRGDLHAILKQAAQNASDKTGAGAAAPAEPNAPAGAGAQAPKAD